MKSNQGAGWVALAIFGLLLAALLAAGCSSDDPADPRSQAPAAPSGLGADDPAYAEAEVSWTDNADDESGFDLEWSLLEDFSVKSTAEPAADAVSHLITGLSAGTRYYLRLRAFNGAGASDWTGGEVTTRALPDGAMVIDADAQYATGMTESTTAPTASSWTRRRRRRRRCSRSRSTRTPRTPAPFRSP